MTASRSLPRAAQTRQVVDVFGADVAAAFGPLGISVTTKVGSQHVIVRPQRADDAVDGEVAEGVFPGGVRAAAS